MAILVFVENNVFSFFLALKDRKNLVKFIDTSLEFI